MNINIKGFANMKKEKEDIKKAEVEWLNEKEGILTEYEYSNLFDGDKWQGHRTIESKYIILADVCHSQLTNIDISMKNVRNQLKDNQTKINNLGKVKNLTKEDKRLRSIVYKISKMDEYTKLKDAEKGFETQIDRFNEMKQRVNGYLSKLPPNETSR